MYVSCVPLLSQNVMINFEVHTAIGAGADYCKVLHTITLPLSADSILASCQLAADGTLSVSIVFDQILYY